MVCRKALISNRDIICRNVPLHPSLCERAALQLTGKDLGVSGAAIVLLCFFFLAVLQVWLSSALAHPLGFTPLSLPLLNVFQKHPPHISAVHSAPHLSVCEHFGCNFE